jgi:hypothetical protein
MVDLLGWKAEDWEGMSIAQKSAGATEASPLPRLSVMSLHICPLLCCLAF